MNLLATPVRASKSRIIEYALLLGIAFVDRLTDRPPTGTKISRGGSTAVWGAAIRGQIEGECR